MLLGHLAGQLIAHESLAAPLSREGSALSDGQSRAEEGGTRQTSRSSYFLACDALASQADQLVTIALRNSQGHVGA